MAEKKLRVMLAGTALNDLVPSLTAACSQMEHALDLTTVSSVEALHGVLKVSHPDVLFLDLSMAQPKPSDVVHMVHRTVPNVPLITFAGKDSQAIAAASMHDGAVGYLLAEDLSLPAVTRVLAAALERNTVHGLIDLLRDPLTSLYTREGFQTLGVRAMETSRAEQRNSILLCALFENLSGLRAKYGLAAADRYLIEISEMFTSFFRDADLVARIGDGQFAVLALNASEPSAPLLLQRLQKRLASLHQSSGTSDPVELRFSMGMSGPSDARSFPEFLDSVESELRHPIAPSTD